MNTEIPNYELMLYADKRKRKQEDLEIYRLGCQMCIHREGNRKDTGSTTQRCKDCNCYSNMDSIPYYNDRGLSDKELKEKQQLC